MRHSRANSENQKQPRRRTTYLKIAARIGGISGLADKIDMNGLYQGHGTYFHASFIATLIQSGSGRFRDPLIHEIRFQRPLMHSRGGLGSQVEFPENCSAGCRGRIAHQRPLKIGFTIEPLAELPQFFLATLAWFKKVIKWIFPNEHEGRVSWPQPQGPNAKRRERK